jgi:hypothetical protein
MCPGGAVLDSFRRDAGGQPGEGERARRFPSYLEAIRSEGVVSDYAKINPHRLRRGM